MNEVDTLLMTVIFRQWALSFDDAGHTLREMGFHNWQRDTLFCEATNRWVREIGERV